MARACYSVLFQRNTRVWLAVLNRTLGQASRLDDLPDADLDGLVAAVMTFPGLRLFHQGPCEGRKSGLYLDVPPWQASVFLLTRCN